MKTSEVPQDRGIYVGSDIVNYAVDERGRYVPVASAGWDAANVANGVAVAETERELAEVLERVRQGRSSRLAYHMTRRRMDGRLLAQYAGLPVRVVRRHLTPEGFGGATPAERAAYADALDMPENELDRTPDPAAGAGGRA